MQPIPQFTAELRFHFREVGDDHSRRFIFGADLHRRVPMQVDALEGLNTIGLWVDHPVTLVSGDAVTAKCRLLSPELFVSIINPGATFELWDGGFIATGTVLERIAEGWSNAA